MKSFVLDSTYKDAIAVDYNDDCHMISSHNLPYNPVNQYNVDLNKTNSSYIAHHTKNDKFNTYNFIDYL